MNQKDFEKMTVYEQEMLWEQLRIRQALSLIIKHLEIINKKHLKKVKK